MGRDYRGPSEEVRTIFDLWEDIERGERRRMEAEVRRETIEFYCTMLYFSFWFTLFMAIALLREGTARLRIRCSLCPCCSR